jgi:adenosylcobyric acid synthase
MSARVLMFQGTGSDVGKSVLVAGLCRLFTNRGLRVAPFKPQNMSNNAAVTPDGGEIGRAQELQARACRLSPSVHMNPILLKPEADHTSQIIVQGQVAGRLHARDWRGKKPTMLPIIADSFSRMAANCDLLLVEGAGSAAETNLREGDVANMGFADALGVPVALIGDIDRGGVIASLVGTYHVLPPMDRARIRAFVINKFRGDPGLFLPALETIAAQTGWTSLGIVPWLASAGRLPAEDAVPLSQIQSTTHDEGLLIAVPMLAHIANFDDLDPLQMEPGVHVRFVPPGQSIPLNADAVVIPGSKSTLADLSMLRAQGWDTDILAMARAGKRVMGLCGGYQMLGHKVSDPSGSDGSAATAFGLGLLNVETVMAETKTVGLRTGTSQRYGAAVEGYEIHMGTTQGADTLRPLLEIAGCPDGAISANGCIEGSYLHGLFASDDFRHAWLASLRAGHTSNMRFDTQVDTALDDIAHQLGGALDTEALLAQAERPGWSPQI